MCGDSRREWWEGGERERECSGGPFRICPIENLSDVHGVSSSRHFYSCAGMRTVSSHLLSIYPSLSLFFSLFPSPPPLYPPFSPSPLLVYFLRACLFASPAWMHVLFFLSRRDLRSFRVFNIIRGSSIIPTIERTEVEVKESEGRRRVFYLRRCYKLFRIVKNSGRTGDSAGQTYGIFHYGSSFAPFFSTQHFLPSGQAKILTLEVTSDTLYTPRFKGI